MKKLSKQQIEVIREQAIKERARRKYEHYLELVHHGSYEHFAHTKLICEYLQRVAEGEQLHLMVELPPRHGKSMTVTETFPSYYLGRNPDKRVITSAYNDDLARKFGRLNRNKFAEFAHQVFDEDISRDNSSTSDWGVQNKRGGMISTGIGGSITGQGADCFVAGTLVDTEIGKMDIKDLHEMEKPPLVLSYNHQSSKLEYKQLQVTRRKKANELTKISTISGNEIISTREHRYYDYERGYREAGIFRPGDKLTVQRVKEEHNVPCLWGKEKRQRHILQSMLPIGKKENSYIGMQLMWNSIRESFLRIQEIIKEKSNRFLLFRKMFKGTPFIQEFKELCFLWRQEKERQQILQQRMHGKGPRRTQNKDRVSGVQHSFCSEITQNGMLFKGMCEQITFNKNDGKTKQSLQRWNELRKNVCGHATFDIGEGQKAVPSLWRGRENDYDCSQSETFKPSDTSQRRGRDEQQRNKLNNAMYNMPYNSSQIESESIRTVENYEEKGTIVYDIQVADNHNFFANNVLVHNCLIIDDPIKNSKEALSKTIRENIWSEWESTLSTRLHDGASVIVIMTRWHEDDLIGRLLATSPYKWDRIRLPAVAEDDDDMLGREIGEPLCPELGYDTDWANLKKQEVGSRTWASLFQQRPSPEQGAIFQRNWIKYVNTAPASYESMVMSWDFTFKDADTSDYVVGQVWQKTGGEFYCIDQIRAQLDFTQSVQAVVNLKNKYPRCRTILIEDKANGPAIINTLKQRVSGIIPITPRESKVARAYAVTPYFEAGNVHYLNSTPHLNDMIEELVSFPNSKHDDTVDATTQALSYFAERPAARVIGANAW